MAAVTVTNRFEGVLAEENLSLFVADGETFSTKIGKPLMVHAMSAAGATSETGAGYTTYVDGFISSTISDKTITINFNGGGGSAWGGGGTALYVTILGRA